MQNVEIVGNSIVVTGATYIAHQCNCISLGEASGIAKTIFDNYTYSNCYKDRINQSIPGTIDIRGSIPLYRGIINMFSQLYPGKPNNKNDTEQLRKKWFHSCLMEMSKINNLDSIAMPYGIGCGLAGGDWEWYSFQIDKFAEYMGTKTRVILYKI